MEKAETNLKHPIGEAEMETETSGSRDWQLALSRAVEALQHLEPLALTRRDRYLARTYIRQAERALNEVEGRCPDCLTPPGAKHYCGKSGVRTYEEMGIPEGDPRLGLEYVG